MFPLYDSTPQERFPLVNYLLLGLNILVFIQQLFSPNPEDFITQFAFVPQLFNLYDFSTYIPVFTSIFIHAGFLHIISNMMFLHIFGDNVEDRLGHIGYLLFYLAGGFMATMTQYMLDPPSIIPLVGASGAISAVAGAYYVLFRNATVKTLVPAFGFISAIDLSAGFVLGYWFISQVFSGLGALTTVTVQHGGVAFFAHIGGFVFGYLVAQNVKQRSANV